MKNASEITKSVTKLISDNSPTILTAVAVTGVVTTTVLAVRATPAAMSKIEAEKAFIVLDSKSEDLETSNVTIKPIRQIKLAWKCYVPAAAMGGVTIACILGANTISSKRNAALMSVYTITDRAFKEYQEKTVEVIGQEKEQKIRDEVVRDRMENDPVTSKEVHITGLGEQLCYDSLTGRYFKSDVESIRRAENTVNAQIIHEMYASQNDFYRAVGMDMIPNGDELGWCTDYMLDINMTSMLAKDGRPCLAINYRVEPKHNYYNVNR